MQNLVKTTDIILISYVRNLLNQKGIDNFVFDGNMGFTEGGIGVFPRRIMVADEDLSVAKRTLMDAGLSNELSLQDS